MPIFVFFCPLEQFLYFLGQQIQFYEKLFMYYHSAPPEPSFDEFEKLPQMGEVGEIGAPQKRGASQI